MHGSKHGEPSREEAQNIIDNVNTVFKSLVQTDHEAMCVIAGAMSAINTVWGTEVGTGAGQGLKKLWQESQKDVDIADLMFQDLERYAKNNKKIQREAENKLAAHAGRMRAERFPN